VVVGKVSDELQMDFTAIGDTVNLAARMQQLADPGSVWVSENTWRAARHFFEFEGLGAVSVKGMSEPVTAYRALRAKPSQTRFQVAASRGLAPFVGRQRELAVLEGHFAEARAGRGQVVFLSGEAGMGKSRLLLELRRRVGPDVPWLEGHCISYGSNIAYHPLVDIARRAFGVEETDDDAAIIRRVDEGTAGWVPSSQPVAPFLKYLLSVDPGDPAIAAMDPRARRAGVFDALRALLLETASGGQLVIAVEDLHWVDGMSREAIAALADVVPRAPVLLILTYRPGPGISLGERTSHTLVALDRLPEDAGAALTQGVLGVENLPGDIQQLVAGKAEGNPFFIEEVTRSLVEMRVLTRSNGTYRLDRPAAEIHIPDTIQEVILARIDRLEPQGKGALQLASVIGREFTARLLDRIAHLEARLEEVLGELKALELIYEKDYFPELAYMFKHALTHDVAYSTLLLERRKVLHRLVAAAVEELYGDRLAEHYETLAHHYDAAADWEKALHYLAAAGDKAAAAYADQDALGYYARALEVCEKLGGDALPAAASLAHRRALVSFHIGDFQGAVADFQQKLTLATALGDRALQGMTLAHRGMAEFFNHDFATAEATLRAALDVADEGFDDCRALACLTLAILLLALGERRAEISPLLAVVEREEARLDAVGRGLWSWFDGRVESWAGRFDEALRKLERGRPAAEDSMANLLWHQWITASALAGRGDYEAALAQLEETLATCERVGDVIVWVRSLNTMGWIYSELEDHQRALEWNQRGLDATRVARLTLARLRSSMASLPGSGTGASGTPSSPPSTCRGSVEQWRRDTDGAAPRRVRSGFAAVGDHVAGQAAEKGGERLPVLLRPGVQDLDQGAAPRRTQLLQRFPPRGGEGQHGDAAVLRIAGPLHQPRLLQFLHLAAGGGDLDAEAGGEVGEAHRAALGDAPEHRVGGPVEGQPRPGPDPLADTAEVGGPSQGEEGLVHLDQDRIVGSEHLFLCGPCMYEATELEHTCTTQLNRAFRTNRASRHPLGGRR
jgi:tetratricopeptide (TPR) repeat protein